MKTFSVGVSNLVMQSSQKKFQGFSLLSSSLGRKANYLPLPVGKKYTS